MPQLHAEQTIDASAEKVFLFLTDPKKIPLVMPGLIENTNVPELPLQVGSSFSYKFQLYGVILDGVWTVTAIEKPSLYSATTTGAASSDWKYLLSEDNGKTRVQLDVSYQTPDSVIAQVAESAIASINQNSAETFLRDLKLLMEMQQV